MHLFLLMKKSRYSIWRSDLHERHILLLKTDVKSFTGHPVDKSSNWCLIKCILIGMQMVRGELEQDVVSRRQGEACQGDTCLWCLSCVQNIYSHIRASHYAERGCSIVIVWFRSSYLSSSSCEPIIYRALNKVDIKANFKTSHSSKIRSLCLMKFSKFAIFLE